MRNSCAIPIRRSASGFSLLEMMIVLAIIVIVGGFAMPMLMTQVYLTRIRYSATGVSGLLQLARMEAVRKNSFYSLNYVAGTPAMVRVVDKSAAVVTTIPPVVLGQSVTSFFGRAVGRRGRLRSSPL
jgi:prepilin-type N-terminal cleavage/methylation domain-containing protein